MKVKLYIEDKEGKYIHIPTYKDENIYITSKVTDSEDISAVYNDISTSFSIPASDEANNVFGFIFELGIDRGGFVANQNYLNKSFDSIIELDSVPYKFGKVYIENIDFEYNRPVNYILNFAGNTISLEDKFSSKKLSNLDLDHYNFSLSLNQMQYSIGQPNKVTNDEFVPIPYSIVTPLFLYTDRNIIYSPGALSPNNIASQPGRINLRELRPGIRVTDIIKSIERTFGVRFYSNFDKNLGTFNDDVFKRPEFNSLYLWLNGDESLITSLELNIKRSDFIALLNEYVGLENRRVELFGVNPGQNRIFNRINKSILPLLGLDPSPTYTWKRSIKVELNSSSQYSYVIKGTSGEIIEDSQGNVTGSRVIETFFNVETFSGNFFDSVNNSEDFIDIQVESTGTVTGKYSVQNYLVPSNQFDGEIYLLNRQTNTTNLIPKIGGGSTFEIKKNVPDITISDFFRGILKAFRLIIIPIDENSYYINTNSDLLNTGNTLNIDELIDIKSSKVSKKVYGGELNFKFEESDLVLQKFFREKVAGRDYGDRILRYDDLIGTENIDVPFTNLLLSNVSKDPNNPVIVGLHQELNDDGQLEKSLDGVFLFYFNGIYNIDNPIHFNLFGTQTTFKNIPDVNIANRIGNKYLNSLSFREELNPNNLYPKTTINLISRFWKNWLDTVYDNKYRKLNVEGVMPNRLINDLKINTKVILDGYIYHIDEYRLNLLDSKLELTLYPKAEVGNTLRINSYITFPKDSLTDIIDLNSNANWKVSLSPQVNWLVNTEQDIFNGDIGLDNKFVYKVLFNNTGNSRSTALSFLNQDTGQSFSIEISQEA